MRDSGGASSRGVYAGLFATANRLMVNLHLDHRITVLLAGLFYRSKELCGRSPECELIDIVDVHIAVTEQDQAAGPLEGGYLQARGFVRPITWKPGPKTDMTLKWMFDDTVVYTGIRVKLDESPNVGGLSPDLHCVPISRYDYGNGARNIWFGLVLEATGKEGAEFRRRGVFDIWDDDLYARIFERGIVRLKEKQTEPDGNDHSGGCDGVQKTDFTII